MCVRVCACVCACVCVCVWGGSDDDNPVQIVREVSCSTQGFYYSSSLSEYHPDKLHTREYIRQCILSQTNLNIPIQFYDVLDLHSDGLSGAPPEPVVQ